MLSLVEVLLAMLALRRATSVEARKANIEAVPIVLGFVSKVVLQDHVCEGHLRSSRNIACNPRDTRLGLGEADADLRVI